LPRSSTTQRVPSPTTIDTPLGTPRIATRSAPRVLSGPPPPDRRVEGSAPPTRFLNRIIGSPRALIAALILLALVPNLTVAAFVWLPALWTPEAKVEEPVRADATGTPDARPKEIAKLAPALTVPSILEANAGEDVALPIALDGTDGVPFRSAIAISGLPAGATLSGGRPYGATGWNLKPDEIGDLYLVLPDAAKGETRLAIRLVDSAGEIVAAAETTLRVAAKPAPAPPAPPPNSDPNPASTEAQEEQTPQDAAMNTDGKPDGAQALNTVDEDPAPSAANDSLERSAPSKNADPAKLAPSDGGQTEKDGDGGNSVQPSTSVNLREGPTSSAAVISVIAKDTKLKVLEQRRRWVKVINPESSESGWIYAPNLDGLPKSRDWSGQASPADEPSEPRESIWKRMGHWLTGG
jgi:Bacterial SH3 domain